MASKVMASLKRIHILFIYPLDQCNMANSTVAALVGQALHLNPAMRLNGKTHLINLLQKKQRPGIPGV
jgi:hypothetical protein